ncbi:MAG: hypothetical protein J2P50_10075, partial [Hyphomicrobiaceae bacterium]|nr:hypothetical protein [Hyphomicrobiaceae bacterium]
MRTLLAAAAAALAIAGGASSPAEAFRAGLREGRVGGPSTVPNHGAASGVRLNLARATADDNDGQEDARPA